jgi:hypothetical protein
MKWISFTTAALGTAVLVQTALAANTFNVTTTSDSHSVGFTSQGAPGSSQLQDSNGNVSLRSALEYASTLGGSSTINLPSGTYNLSLGDLVVGVKATTTIYLHGQGTAANTTVHQTQSHRLVFVVNYNVDPNVVFTLDNVTVSGGNEDNTDPDGFGGNGGAILAGGSSSAAGNAVNLTSVIFTGNSTSGNANGGAISMSGGGDLTVSNCTFSGNQAGKSGNGAGGAIYFDAGFSPGNVSISASTFSNNLATGTLGLGGALYLASGNGNPFTISQGTFTGNSAAVRGGAIDLETGHLTASFNRLSANTAPTASGIYVLSGGGWADARNNWWGSSSGANGTGSATTFPASNSSTPLSAGQISFNPWIVLAHTANPADINGPGTSPPHSATLTASFLQNSASQTLSSAQVSALEGVPIAFQNAVKGTLSGAQTSIQSSGTATATFTATAAGAGSADAVVDNQTATASITIATAVNSISRATGSPSNLSSVQWTVTFADAVSGVTSSDFTLVNSGLSGSPGITSVVPNGSAPATTWTVTATTGSGDGTLGLNMTSQTGVSAPLNNLNFTGEVYSLDRTAPSISSVSGPTSGRYRVGDNLNFTVQYSESVTVTGVPTIGLTIGAASRSASYFSGSGSGTLVFRYTVSLGDTDNDGITSSSPILLNGGTIQDAAGNNAGLSFSPPDTTGVLVGATLLGRYVFYNHSAWDGNTPGADAQDDNAIAPDKQALISPGIASAANYTSYSRGLNGIMLDIAGLPGTPGLSDFAFKMGNDNSPRGWAAAPTPSSLTIRAGAGAGGSDRLTLIWDDSDLTAPLGSNEAVAQQWLQVRVKSSANTGLAADDIFYFGNAVGEGNVGNSGGAFPVTAADALQALNNLNALGVAPLTDANDHNRDKKVTAEDALISLNNQSGLAPLVQLDLSGGQPQTLPNSDSGRTFAGGFLGAGKSNDQFAQAWLWAPNQANPTLWFSGDLQAAQGQPIPSEWLRPVGGGILQLTFPTSLNLGFIHWSAPPSGPANQ